MIEGVWRMAKVREAKPSGPQPRLVSAGTDVPRHPRLFWTHYEVMVLGIRLERRRARFTLAFLDSWKFGKHDITVILPGFPPRNGVLRRRLAGRGGSMIGMPCAGSSYLDLGSLWGPARRMSG